MIWHNKNCSSCGWTAGHAEGCFSLNRVDMHIFQKEPTTELKVMKLADGYYIAELKHPLHKKERCVVKVRHNRFLETEYSINRSLQDGLDNFYKLVGKIDTQGLFVDVLYNDIKCKDLTAK